MNEVCEMFLDHLVHSFGENGVFGLEQFATRVSPLFDGMFNESFGDDERIIVWEFSGLRPAPRLSDQIFDWGRFDSL